jgi:hypothetical protein
VWTQATKLISTAFDSYRRIQNVAELQDQIATIENDLKHQVFDDFKQLRAVSPFDTNLISFHLTVLFKVINNGAFTTNVFFSFFFLLNFDRGINSPRETLQISLADACKLIDALGPEAR